MLDWGIKSVDHNNADLSDLQADIILGVLPKIWTKPEMVAIISGLISLFRGQAY